METADEITVVPDRLVAPLDNGQRAFRIALALAFLCHAAMFVRSGRSMPRTMGDRSGVSDAIAVELVTEADLKSLESVALPPAGAPPPPAAAAPQPETKPSPEPEPQPQPQPETKAEAAPPAPAEPQPKEPTPKEEATAALEDFDTVLKDLATAPMPDPNKPAEEAREPSKAEEKTAPETPPEERKPEEAKPAEKKQPAPAKKAPAPQARLDPSPQDFQNAPPGRSAGASRPPGITRSGENDDFGRGVIRALRQTMPAPQGIFGRVTVRLILNENGDLAEVRVLDASGTSLDQSVVFATKQTYFPLPPYNSTLADRTFMITYVYR
jgi:TonB family protein